MTLKQLESFFANYSPSDEPLGLSGHEVLNDQKLFIETHLTALKCNPGNRTFYTTYLRLLKYYELINNQ